MVGFDKAGINTGPGQGGFLFIGKESTTKFLFKYILFNYNIDGNVLKKEHKKLLDWDIIPFVKTHRVHVKLTGTASQSGDWEYNRQLSAGRVLRVKEYLLSRGLTEAQVPGPDIRAAGEALSTSKSMENPRDRAVRLTIAVGIKPLPLTPTIVVPVIITINQPDPIIRPSIEKKPKEEKEYWTIRQTFGFSGSAGWAIGIPGFEFSGGVGPVQYSFLLVNRRTYQMSLCTFAGPAVSVGLGGRGDTTIGRGPSGALSMTGQSTTWDNFETAGGVDFSDFNGVARWTEPGVAGLGSAASFKAVLSFPKLEETVRVTTGKTFGFPSASTSVGSFYCGKPYQLQRN